MVSDEQVSVALYDTTMKFMIVALALVAVAAAATLPEPEVKDEVVEVTDVHNPDGSYITGFKTKSGIERYEEGTLKEALDEEGKPHTVVAVRGTYAYVDKEGNREAIEYSADENGYAAEGPSVPKAQV